MITPIFLIFNYLENNLLSPGAYLRKVPPCGTKAGERIEVRGK
jgi:hypothetical protein